ncbi:radical SAM protein [Candidatus Woesearchaeota archaeon]|nr:radical SAM protein [Candidatus Woesearchaeota archaeon]
MAAAKKSKAVQRKIENTGVYSYRIGPLAKGCQQCVKGEKTVLFVTGLCPRKCIYCPISDKKSKQDVTYANEWPTSDINEIIEEARLCASKGAGFTGGDPLTKLNRTCAYIRALKKAFGKSFHVHLYTSFDLATEERLRSLYDAGLDEIRFHADIDDDKLWPRIDIANKFGWEVGIEIPVIPGKKEATIKLMDFFNRKIKFMNLNELEVSDAKANTLSQKGFRTKDRLSYGVEGSDKLARELLKHAQKHCDFNVHYCTAKLKDRVQLASRIKRRAKNTKQYFDILNSDGTLTRGTIYLDFLIPSFDYQQKLDNLTQSQRKFALHKLQLARQHLARHYGVPLKLIAIDPQRLRIITNPGVTQNLAEGIKSMHLKPAIVTEYPTWDALIVELEFL